MKKLGIIIGMVAFIILGWIAYTNPFQSSAKADFLKEQGWENLSVEEIVYQLESEVGETEFGSSIFGDRLMIQTATQEYSFPTPQDKFYLSVAPYIYQTHPCTIHNLTGCQGELVNQEVSVLIESTDGTILFDDEISTFENGFFGIWLPRGVDGTITVTLGGKTASTAISTYADSATCLTTLQLQ